MATKKTSRKHGKKPAHSTRIMPRAAAKKHQVKRSETKPVVASVSKPRGLNLGFAIWELAFFFVAGATTMAIIQISITKELNRYYANLELQIPAQIVTTGQEAQPAEPALPATPDTTECGTDQDCISPVEICSATQKCVPLLNPTGQCTQPMVLSYTERSTGRTKHTFCERGCSSTTQGARCL